MRAHREWFRLGLICLLATPVSIASSALAQTYPTGPVKFITQLAAGSGTDPAMRIVTDRLGKIWGQQTVLVNQPGAGGAIAARTAATAAPDGHTLFMAIASTFTILPVTQPNLAFNVNDFAPIGFVGEVPIAIAVSPTLPVNSLPELIAHSKGQPGGLDVAVGLRGGITHLASELFRGRSGADLTAVFYPGAAQAMSDVISGRVPVLIDGLAGPLAAGQLKLLAIASPARLASRPGVPTVSETVSGLVCLSCASRHPSPNCQKSKRRPAHGPRSTRHQGEIRRACPLNTFDVTAGAREFYLQRATIVEAGDQADRPCNPVRLPRQFMRVG
jgi:tripartite-type tricarboxylate transporter receptor subunit TctC